MRFVNSLTILRNRHICCLLEHPTTILTTGFYVQSSRERARILTLNLPTACLQFDKDGRRTHFWRKEREDVLLWTENLVGKKMYRKKRRWKYDNLGDTDYLLYTKLE